MRFILFRHGEKESSSSPDPGLSYRGLRQAQILEELVMEEKMPKPSLILSSPKIRAQQTVLPLSMRLQLPLRISEDLLERQFSESAVNFRLRVQSFIQSLEKQNGVIYAVAHFDWIEEFLDFFGKTDETFNKNQYHSWRQGQFMDLEVNSGVWTLKFFGQLLYT